MLTTELQLAITATLESALNNYLRLDSEHPHRLSRLAGKYLAIELLGMNTTIYLLADDKGIQLFNHYEGEADATLSGTPLALMRLALTRQPGPAMFSDDLTLSGDTELGQQYKRLFDSLDIDWEEHLSRYSGDILAHKLAGLVRSGLSWNNQARTILQQDIAEYLLQEQQLVTEKAELQRFFNHVDVLREDVDRLQARIEHLLSTTA